MDYFELYGNLSEDAKDIIRKLLEKNPKKRLGSQRGIEEIKEHPFFQSIDFSLIEQKKIPDCSTDQKTNIISLTLDKVINCEFNFKWFTNYRFNRT